jgi:very-short-patch-repair endonuclease
VRVFPSVFRVAGAPMSWRQQIEALLLWGGRGVVLSHRTAAALHGFNHFPEGPLEVTTTRRTRIPKDVRVYRVSAMRPRDLTRVYDLDVTSETRTLVDLAALTERSVLHAAIDQALREKKTTLDKLEAAVKRAGNRPGVIDLRSLLDEFQGQGGPTESELEYGAVSLIVDAGLPRPEVQWRVVVGRKRRRLDLCFTELGVVIETDGYASHSGIGSFEDDRARNNSLIVRGLRVLHWTWEAIQQRPEELIAELYVVLNSRR